MFFEMQHPLQFMFFVCYMHGVKSAKQPKISMKPLILGDCLSMGNREKSFGQPTLTFKCFVHKQLLMK